MKKTNIKIIWPNKKETFVSDGDNWFYAAQKAGFKTAFVKRNKEWGENTEVNVNGEYDVVVDNFVQLRDYLTVD